MRFKRVRDYCLAGQRKEGTMNKILFTLLLLFAAARAEAGPKLRALPSFSDESSTESTDGGAAEEGASLGGAGISAGERLAPAKAVSSSGHRPSSARRGGSLAPQSALVPVSNGDTAGNIPLPSRATYGGGVLAMRSTMQCGRGLVGTGYTDPRGPDSIPKRRFCFYYQHSWNRY